MSRSSGGHGGRDEGAAWTTVSQRFGLIGTLCVAMAVSTFMAFALGTLAPFLVTELALTRAQLGMLTTLMFLIGGVLSPAAGSLVDSRGAKQLLQVLFIAAGVSLVQVATAPSYILLVVASCVGGLALAINNPATNKLVGEHVPAGQQGIVMAIKQSGVQIGAFLTGLLPVAALVFGWRGALLLAVAVVLAGMIGTQVWVPPDPDQERVRPRARRGQVWPAVGWLGAYAFLMGCGVAVLGAYLPLYAHERLAVDVTTAGFLASFVGLTGVLARVAWGRIGDLVQRIAGPLVLIAVFATVGQVLVWTAEAVGTALLWGGAFLLGASAVAWNAVGMLAIVKVLDVSEAGRASGLVLLGFYAGYVIGPVGFGFSVDLLGTYAIGWAFVTICYVVSLLTSGMWYVQQRQGSRPRERLV